MYKAYRALPHISGHQLDEYLAHGWYRMDQRLFTEQFLQERFKFRNAIWLRQKLSDFEFPGWYQKMRRKALFNVEVVESGPTPQHELLYQEYLSSKPKGFPESLENILYGEYSENIFNSRLINVYDRDQLVASGFFDLGERSAEGIVNFYNPAYAKHRLGKYLYLYAMEWCKQAGMEYFYPGYFVPGNSRFDYKISFHQSSLEFYVAATKSWLPFSVFDPNDLPLELMEKRLKELKSSLQQQDISALIIYNALYCLIQNARWDTPLFLMILPLTPEAPRRLVSFDTNSAQFMLFQGDHIYPDQDMAFEDSILICLKPPITGMPLAHSSSVTEILQKITSSIHS